MPEILFPQDAYGIPRLRTDQQVRQVLLPVYAWGSRARKSRVYPRGGWHFYVDDYRFEAVWSKPDQPLIKQPQWLGECNWSVEDSTPTAVAIWATYRKRWLSRYWQERGVPILVDIHVAERHADINLIGVPVGWSSFATRADDAHLHELGREYEIAKTHAETDNPLFLVVGGGPLVREWCTEHDCPNLRYPTGKRVHSAGGYVLQESEVESQESGY